MAGVMLLTNLCCCEFKHAQCRRAGRGDLRRTQAATGHCRYFVGEVVPSSPEDVAAGWCWIPLVSSHRHWIAMAYWWWRPVGNLGVHATLWKTEPQDTKCSEATAGASHPPDWNWR